MPFSTHVSLPVLGTGSEPEVQVKPGEMLDAEDLPTDLPPRSRMKGEHGVQATNIEPPSEAESTGGPG
jgi:hypothetical protein